MRSVRSSAAATAAAFLLLAAAPPASAAQTTQRVSVGPGGRQANDGTLFSSISGDGRFVAFVSAADNLVPGDTNRTYDVFVHDRRTGRTERVSTGPGGRQASDASGLSGAAISADGRYVAFGSLASNLVGGDTNDHQDVFVHDRQTGRTERVSVGPGGRQANSYSGVNNLAASISGDGRYVTFNSAATNLVAGDTNRDWDVFVHDRRTGRTQRASTGFGGKAPNSRSGVGGPVISADGRYVAYDSDASNLVRGGTNSGRRHVFVYAVATGENRLVDVGPSGEEANAGSNGASISADGRRVAFASVATNLVPGHADGSGPVHAFVRDLVAGVTEEVDLGPGGTDGVGDVYASGSLMPAISGDGRYVAFTSDFTNLVPNDTNDVQDIFVRDLARAITERVSVGPGGRQANNYSGADSLSLSTDGSVAAFDSDATNLVPNDTNGARDVFVRTGLGR